jgi:hypothetical protein
MTQKTIKLANQPAIETIGKGTVLKLRGDLFIVAEIETRKEVDVISQALSSSYTNRMTKRYALISFQTGDNYFNSLDPLTTLHRKISENNRFEVVRELEIAEVL